MTDAPPTRDPMLDEDGRVILTGISSRAFEHPSDRTALTAMRAVPGFDQLLRVASSMLRERQYRLVYLASAVRVDERQFSDLHELLGQVCNVLDAPARPELFVFNDPQPNAITLGVDKPFIALSSGMYELTDQDERRFVLAHELGHALSGHALYQSLLLHLLNLIGAFGWLPAGGLGLRALVAGLREWQRKAELSGDRAGLLATQDLDAALRVAMKLAGGSHLDRIDVAAFLQQADDYEGAGDLRDGVLKLLNTERTTHPFAVIRAAEINRWAASEEYRDILAGNYPRREDDQTASFSENAREAGRTYRRRIDESTDPLVTAVRGFGATVGTAADSVFDWLSRHARGGVQETTAPNAESPDPAPNAESPDPAPNAESPDPAPNGESPDPEQPGDQQG